MTEQSDAVPENPAGDRDAAPAGAPSGAPRAADPAAGADGVRVAILAGGLSHERDVSLRSGRRVAAALRDKGLRVEVLDVDANLLATLERHRPDVVWPLVHG